MSLDEQMEFITGKINSYSGIGSIDISYEIECLKAVLESLHRLKGLEK